MTEAKILLYDLEITPILGWVYDMYDANVIKMEQPKQIMSFAHKWLGEDTIHVSALPDCKGYRAGKVDDKILVQRLWKLLDEADVVIAHNANRFDNKVAMARFAYHGMTPPSPFATVDTLAVARRVFRFDANSLNFLCDQLGIGVKTNTKHSDVWYDCILGDLVAWEEMRAYNRHDIVLLEGLYRRIRPYVPNHPLVGNTGCPKCGSAKLQQRGLQRNKVATYQRWHCQECGAWSRSRLAETTIEKPEVV